MITTMSFNVFAISNKRLKVETKFLPYVYIRPYGEVNEYAISLSIAVCA